MTDLVVRNCSEVVTCDPSCGVVESGAVAITDGRVTWVGPDGEAPVALEELDAAGRAVVPGLVDAHTHLVFAGERREEFAARASGRPYEAGGILTTVDATNAATDDDLLEGVLRRLDHLLAHGTTTVEAKSGYALTTEGERRLLQLLAEADRRHPVNLEITFCGAHAVPPGTDPDAFVEGVAEEMTPVCAPLARWVDVFCDQGAFTAEQSRRVLRAGREHGLEVRIHANELADSGGVELACELAAASADHLLFVLPEQASAMAAAGVTGVLCPVTALSLGRFPDARMMREAGMTLALGSDLNPGMAPDAHLQLAIAIAVRTIGMDPTQALAAATAGAAASLRRPDIGRLIPGSRADLVILASDSHLSLGYEAGANLADVVVCGGVVAEGSPRPDLGRTPRL
ncbi:MAG TPA: imidazolonepropionase [Actinomycetota bacterium]|nr:imidazolonepropionase [Actinomycetota bacterium]